MADVGRGGMPIEDRDAWDHDAVLALPDLATCSACLDDIRAPDSRRYRYPFTSCIYCGPRFSILEKLPYRRAHTTMHRFHMCEACQREYRDPESRRFHAHPNACPDCGPTLSLWDPTGLVLARADEALERSANALKSGAIVAVKGLGGFHLMVLASDPDAVRRLRRRKQRAEKPFAMMAPTLAAVRHFCKVSPEEEALLGAAQAPIVLLTPRVKAEGAFMEVAPGSLSLGFVLPYTPLHHLLLEAVTVPVVVTSGNLDDEPICIDENEALERLGSVADLLLVHDRPILRPLDDSIARVSAEGVMLLRRARGFAPMPFTLPGAPREHWLAVGGQRKNTVAVSVGPRALLGQHVGDLETPGARKAFLQATEDLSELCGAGPARVACDSVPDGYSVQHAAALGLPITRVQHHHAHVRACMLDNAFSGAVLGVAWDGMGHGTDGHLWGGEFLVIDDQARPGDFRRVAHLRSFPLPGGDAVLRQPWRTALGLLYELHGAAAVDTPEWHALSPLDAEQTRELLTAMADAPRTTSAGRLFDGVSALLGLCTRSGHEAQAAMLLEHAAANVRSDATLRLTMRDVDGALLLDWEPLLRDISRRHTAGRWRAELAAMFHDALCEAIVDVAREIAVDHVALTGGCFQNRRLLEGAAARLRQAGFSVLTHHHVPPNDGGLALGQLAAVARGAQTT